MSLTVYHNPRCSKSREALALLQGQDLAPTVIEYLKAPPTLAELKALQGKLGLSARAMLRAGEEEYKQLGLADPTLTDAQLLAAIAAHPKLLQRPIVVKDERALIARPPELALQLR